MSFLESAKNFLQHTLDWILVLGPWGSFLAVVVTAGFAAYVAVAQMPSSRTMKACAFLAFVAIVSLEWGKLQLGLDDLERRNNDEKREQLNAADIKATLDKVLKSQELSNEDGDTLLLLLGRSDPRMIQYFQTIVESHVAARVKKVLETEQLCARTAGEAAILAVHETLATQVKAICGQAKNDAIEASRAVYRTLSGEAESAALRIEATGGRVRKDWEVVASDQKQHLITINDQITKASSGVENTNKELDETQQALEKLRLELMAKKSETEKTGVLVRLEGALEGMDEDVAKLSEAEKAIVEYRRCSAKRPWPLRILCSRLIPEEGKAENYEAELAYF